ncbi:sterol desaturase family protein [Qipengyuania sp. RANM35]|uniref:sterol desaturase family protein n=1 Tax=Qipengyuania sp. RANM35 TaxID=3068635 RepID=UPI0034DB1160
MNAKLEAFAALPPFLFTWTTFFAAGAIFFLLRFRRRLVQWSVRDLFQTLFPFDPLRSKSFHADLKVYVIRKLTDFIFLAPGTAVWAMVATATAAALGTWAILPTGAVPGLSGILVVAVTLTLLGEFVAFGWHYAEHKVPFMWELHKVHHAAETLNPFTNQRAHSLVLVGKYSLKGLVGGVPSGLFMHYWGFSLVEVLAIGALANQLLTISTLDALRHSEFPVGFGPLDRLFISPHMHQVHHSSLEVHWDRNFGSNLSIFDWMFGTAYHPQKGEEIVYGIYGLDEQELAKYYTLKGTYIDPVVKSLRCIRDAVIPRAEHPEVLAERLP